MDIKISFDLNKKIGLLSFESNPYFFNILFSIDVQGFFMCLLSNPSIASAIFLSFGFCVICVRQNGTLDAQIGQLNFLFLHHCGILVSVPNSVIFVDLLIRGGKRKYHKFLLIISKKRNHQRVLFSDYEVGKNAIMGVSFDCFPIILKRKQNVCQI